jgi:type VI secretion system secreted protein VgrG
MRKGSRVLLSFVGGDPDRPIITGAMPNAAQPSVVTSDNQTKSKIQTRAGNLIEIEDKSDSNRIKLYSPHQNTYFHMGASNHPGDGLVFITDGIERREIKGGFQHTYLTRDVLTSAGSLTTSGTQSATASDPTGGVNLIDEQSIFEFSKLSSEGSSTGTMTATEELSGDYNTSRQVGPSYRYTSGNQFNYIANYRTFRFGAEYSEIHAATASANKGKETSNSFNFPSSMSGAISFNPATSQQEKVFSDALTFQTGRNYSWGNTCDYQFGNTYIETHLSVSDTGVPSSAINAIKPNDLAGSPTSSGFSKTSIAGGSVTIPDINNAQVEKVYGHTYAFQEGHAIDVAVGNTESRRYGDEFQYLSGNTNTYILSAHTDTTVAESAVTSKATFKGSYTETSSFSQSFTENKTFSGRGESNITYGGNFFETHTMAGYGTHATFKHINGNLTEYNAVGAVNQMRAIAGAQSEMGTIIGANIRMEATLGVRIELDFTGGLHLDIGTAPFKIEIDEDNQKIKVVALGVEWDQNPPLNVRNVLVGIVTGGLNLYL